MTSTAQQLSEDDFCRRLPWLLARWEPSSLPPKSILARSVAHGLMSNADDPGEAASEEVMRLATEVGIDTAETDLLGLAEHISALANFLTWMLRATGLPWQRPEPVKLPNGSTWFSGAFLGASERDLRHIALVDRWDAWTRMALENSWAVRGEIAVYRVPMTAIAIPVGKLRSGRWSNPFTAAWRHPVAKTLRFQRRDGADFGQTWEKVWREKDEATREEWLEAMTEDGVLAESVTIHPVQLSPLDTDTRTLAEKSMLRVAGTREIPDPQFSRCFDRIRLCPFRVACPRGAMPSEALGFLPKSQT